VSDTTAISWTDMTFNPWIGCAKVSPGCAHCYAATDTFARVKRAQGVELWGKGKPRHRTSEAYWKDPVKWNKEAALTVGEGGIFGDVHRPRVFCASLADWLDDEVPIEWLAELMTLIGKTPNLDWQLLTKRPENFRWRIRRVLNWFLIHIMDLDLSNSIAKLDPNFSHCLPVLEKSWEDRQTYIRENNAGLILVSRWLGSESDESDDIPPENVWIGTTVENQEMADKRIPELLKIPAKVRFLSCEPLLEQVTLSEKKSDGEHYSWLCDTFHDPNSPTKMRQDPPRIHWVIAGGESGPGFRLFNPDWARSLRDQCKAAGVAFHMKQMGGLKPSMMPPIPADLMIREFPERRGA
jgi:protein gp37